ncbi:hypothetical protein [Streptomyces sp. NBC_00306]|uniref:hypothetical protein n=1 Tax=Streptomyces sp. NBC_00306 TaxID=2975708 RepID=UPI002E27B00A|nr:hypothetical protein [Streptomyces sp. NBC_00306]
MDAALAGLLGTMIGAISGFSGAWLAQRGQVRMQREQRAYDERVRWLDDKRHLYRDLLLAVFGWHDALISIMQDEADGTLHDTRAAAYKLGVETDLIASEPVRLAAVDMRKKLLAAQGPILHGEATSAQDALKRAIVAADAFEEAVRSELIAPSDRYVPKLDAQPTRELE